MTITRTLLAGLLGCTMLAGCNSDDKKDADAAGSSTFASDVDALKQDNAKLNAKVGELQAAAAGTATVSVTAGKLQGDLEKVITDLGTLQARASAGEAEGGALAGEFKLLQDRVAALTTALSNLDKSSATKQQLDTLNAVLSALDKSSATKEQLDTLSASLAGLKTTLGADIAALDQKSATKEQLDTLNASLAGLKTTLGADIAALDQKAASKEQLDKLASDLSALTTNLTTLSDLQQADHKLTVSAAASKISTIDFPAASDRLNAADAARQPFAALLPRIDQTMKDIAAVQAVAGISADDKAKIAEFATQTTAINDDFTKSLAEFDKGISDARVLTEKVSAALASGDTETAAKLSAELEALPKTLETLAKNIADTTAALDKRLAPYSGPWEESLEFLRPRSDAPLTKYVNLYIGTSTNGDSGFSGNLSPSAQLPFGWVNFGPSMTRAGFNGSGGYQYNSSTIPYFSIKHLNGPGCTNHGEVAMLPSNSTSTMSGSFGPVFDRANELAQPGYYKVKFNVTNITTELTATQRTGMVRLTYDNKDKAFLHFDARVNSQNRSGVPADMVELTLDASGKSISGKTVVSAFCAPWGGGWNQPVYFYATFDKPLKPAADGVNVVTANKTVALQFDLSDADKTVQVKIGTSSVSTANAKLNVVGDAQFKGENPGWSFDDTRKLADDTWNKRLNTIQIDLAKSDPAKLTENQKNKMVQFYSALYRVFGGPTVYSDVNGEYRSFRQAKVKDASGQDVWPAYDDESNGKKVLNTPIPARETAKVSDYTYKKADGTTGGYKTHYSGFSTWDTYRTQAPFLALVAPDEASEMMQSLVAIAKQCGAFPHFADGSDDAWAMSGDSSITIVSGSYAFGAKSFDLASAAKFFKQATFDPNSACNNKRSYNTGTWTTEAQTQHYFTNGYFADTAVSTVDSAIHDRSAAAFLKGIPASALADSGATAADITALLARASNWTNVFDTTSKTLKDRAAVTVDAGVVTKGPFKEGIKFHEATEPNYFWSFGHAWSDLINKLGTDRSTAKLAAMTRLNTLFSLTPDLSGPEPSSRQLNGGESSTNYYVGNEMAFSAPWAYNWAGSPKHAQYVLKTILDKNFSNDPGGLPGNDDLGALTSWYVFAALGIYPIIPSEPGFAVSTPQFDGISFWMPNGKKLRFTTGGKSALLDDVRFIQDMKLNATTYQGTWLPLDKIKDGGQLTYTLSKTPTGWGEGEALTPPSGPAGDYSKPTANPVPGVQVIQ